MSTEFLREFGGYVADRVFVVDLRWICTVVVAVVAVVSVVVGRDRYVFLSAVDKDRESVLEVVRVLSMNGNYEVARKIYMSSSVLGSSSFESDLERVLYPDRFIQQEIVSEMKKLERSPYLRSSLVNLSRLYDSIGDNDTAKKYRDLVEWVGK